MWQSISNIIEGVLMNSWHPQSALKSLLTDADFDLELYLPLLTIQSLTRGLEGLNPEFSVDLLHLGSLQVGEIQYFSRRVKLKLKEQAVIAAESLCDENSQFWCEYLNCGTQSLGRRLFNGENVIERTPFEYALIAAKELPDFAQEELYEDEVIIARRSLFFREEEQLSLIEYYLPSLNHFKSC